MASAAAAPVPAPHPPSGPSGPTGPTGPTAPGASTSPAPAALAQPLPSSPTAPLVGGHAAAFNRDPLGFLTRCARDHGDFVPLHFGATRALLVSDPDAIEDVLVNQQQHFGKSVSTRSLRPLAGDGLLTSDGDVWKRQRRLAQPAFHRARIAAFGDAMAARAERLVSDAPAAWRDGETREVYKEMMRLTLEILAKALFDADVVEELAEIDAASAAALAELQAKNGSRLSFLPWSVPVPGHLRFRAAVRRLDRIIYRFIGERRATGEERGDLLSMLLDAHDDGGDRLTDRELRDEVLILFLAGHETTSLALTWTWYLLAQHPEVEARLVAEVDGALGGRSPAAADLPRLPYADKVISEALRLYPPAWIVGREAVRDCVVGGYPVARGTSAMVSQWVMHRHPRFFADAEAFRPERWEDGLAKRLPRFAYFPFGGGPRLCIGKPFGMMQAVLVLAAIVQRARLSLAPGQRVTPLPSVTLRPSPGIEMVLHRR